LAVVVCDAGVLGERVTGEPERARDVAVLEHAATVVPSRTIAMASAGFRNPECGLGLPSSRTTASPSSVSIVLARTYVPGFDTTRQDRLTH